MMKRLTSRPRDETEPEWNPAQSLAEQSAYFFLAGFFFAAFFFAAATVISMWSWAAQAPGELGWRTVWCCLAPGLAKVREHKGRSFPAIVATSAAPLLPDVETRTLPKAPSAPRQFDHSRRGAKPTFAVPDR